MELSKRLNKIAERHGINTSPKTVKQTTAKATFEFTDGAVITTYISEGGGNQTFQAVLKVGGKKIGSVVRNNNGEAMKVKKELLPLFLEYAESIDNYLP